MEETVFARAAAQSRRASASRERSAEAGSTVKGNLQKKTPQRATVRALESRVRTVHATVQAGRDPACASACVDVFTCGLKK